MMFFLYIIYFYKFIYKFIYLFIFGCVGSSLVAASGGYSVVVRGLLIAVASLVEHRL